MKAPRLRVSTVTLEWPEDLDAAIAHEASCLPSSAPTPTPVSARRPAGAGREPEMVRLSFGLGIESVDMYGRASVLRRVLTEALAAIDELEEIAR